MVNRHLKEP